MKNQRPDKVEAALELLEKEEKEFQNHWVWKKLDCKPEVFFSKIKKHLQSLNVSHEEWKAAYEEAKQIHEIRCKEQGQRFNGHHLKMMAAIRI